jgi:hypothetical protein
MMVVSDVGKLAAIFVFLVGLFVLVGAQVVEWGEAAPFFTLVAGYLFGGGEAAVRKQAPSAMLVPNLDEHTVATNSGPHEATIAVVTAAETIDGGTDHGPEA